MPFEQQTNKERFSEFKKTKKKVFYFPRIEVICDTDVH